MGKILWEIPLKMMTPVYVVTPMAPLRYGNLEGFFSKEST